MRRYFLKRMAMAVLITLLFAFCGYAQDKPVEVPNGLPAAVNKTLNTWKYDLQKTLQGLEANIGNHNQKCDRVRRGSAQDMECLQNLVVLQRQVNAYSNEVREFNRAVMQAMSSSPPAWARENDLRDAPASKPLDRSEIEARIQAAFALATLFVQKGDYDQALSILQDALNAKPNDENIQEAYNRVLTLKNRQMADIIKGLKANYLLDALDYGKGDWEASINYLSKIQTREPNNPAARDALVNLNEVYSEVLQKQAIHKMTYQDYDGALACLKKANEKNPQDRGLASFLTFVEGLSIGYHRGKGDIK
jgi:tetratricopeptide (TPR) repeat protein